MGDKNPRRTLGDYSRPSHEGYRNTIELPDRNDLVPLRSDTIWLVQNECSFHRLRSDDPNQHLKDFLKFVDSIDLIGTIDQAAGGKLRDKNNEESWALLEDLALYDNESWNNPRDFAKPVKAISMPQDVPSTFDRCLIELKNKVQLVLMTLNIAWKILSKLLLITHPRETTEWEVSRLLLAKDQEPLTKPPMLGKTNPTSVGNVPKPSQTRKVKKEGGSRDTASSKHEDSTSGVDNDVGSDELEDVEEDDSEYFNTFPSMMELEYHEWLLKNPRPPWDTTSVIDHDLGEVVFGKPFVEEIGLIYDKEVGTIAFREDNELITFKMPHKMEMFNEIDLKDMNTDNIPPFFLENKNENGKVYYSNSLIIGPEYKRDENTSKEIRCLMKLEREAKTNQGGVT
ncbi:hypothetical protein Tco_0706492 [Tanacetum coccineum]|uniref:MAK10-like protein n=1 Tax=Tanacetum coccineum TaxID=301880 RepID=A0ABQ4Y961_9ASTR